MSNYDEEHPFEITDCLVLEICHDEYNKMFIIYDFYENCYFIKGLNNIQNYYNFRCDNIDEICNFINFIFSHQKRLTILLNNYKNLPYKCNDISFDILNDIFIKNYYDGSILVSQTMDLNIALINIKEQLNVINSLYNNY